MNQTDTIIIGTGPAGLFAAIHCKGFKSIVLEKNASAGKKLLISGTGRCNLTHEGKTSGFLKHYGGNFRFLKTALQGFNNAELVNFFEIRGLKTTVDKNGKVFPVTQRSKDVLKVLMDACLENDIEIAYNQKVVSVGRTEGGFVVQAGNNFYHCRFLLIATGGMSYPATGSTGDGYHFAKQLGHSIVPPKPSLSPVIVSGFHKASLAGVSLTDKPISLYRENRKINEHRGDIGFTHHGLTGPGILDFSRFVRSGDVIKINFIDLKTENFRIGFINALEKEGKLAIQTYMKRFELPRSLLSLILLELKMEPETRLAEIDKSGRNLLVAAFCEYPFQVKEVGGFNMAMVTAGGVELSEVDTKTMESKLVPGLFFAGEVLDIDGDTGGYNLQAAFSTGLLAAKSIGKKFLGNNQFKF